MVVAVLVSDSKQSTKPITVLPTTQCTTGVKTSAVFRINSRNKSLFPLLLFSEKVEFRKVLATSYKLAANIQRPCFHRSSGKDKPNTEGCSVGCKRQPHH